MRYSLSTGALAHALLMPVAPAPGPRLPQTRRTPTACAPAAARCLSPSSGPTTPRRPAVRLLGLGCPPCPLRLPHFPPPSTLPPGPHAVQSGPNTPQPPTIPTPNHATSPDHPSPNPNPTITTHHHPRPPHPPIPHLQSPRRWCTTWTCRCGQPGSAAFPCWATAARSATPTPPTGARRQWGRWTLVACLLAKPEQASWTLTGATRRVGGSSWEVTGVQPDCRWRPWRAWRSRGAGRGGAQAAVACVRPYDAVHPPHPHPVQSSEYIGSIRSL